MNQTPDTYSQLSAMPLWHLRKDNQHASCDIIRIPVGYEGRFSINGQFLYSYQFEDLDGALEWAFSKRSEFRRRGWYFIPSSMSVAS